MSVGLLTAGSGQQWESDVVAALDRPGSALTVLRRCVDIAEVLAEAGTGAVAAVVVSADLRRLDTEAVRRLAAGGVAVVAIFAARDSRAPVRLQRIGIEFAVADDLGATAVLDAVRSAILAGPVPDGREETALISADPLDALPLTGPPAPPADLPDDGDDGPPGFVVTVWGPTGAPGRSTVAAGLAVAAARSGCSTLLIDADVYGGIQTNAFGLLDESPGLAGACRMAANGRLDLGELTALAWSIDPDLSLLTGITRADRWPELRPSTIPLVLRVARSMAALVVLDLGFSLETDERFVSGVTRKNQAS